MRFFAPTYTRHSVSPERRLYSAVAVLAALSVVLILGLNAYQMVRTKHDRIEREKDILSRMAQIVESDTINIVGRLSFFFQAADLWLVNHPEADPRFDPDFRTLVDDFREATKHQIDIRLVSKSGGLYYIPSKNSVPLADVSDRGYFKVQFSPSTRGLYIGDPVKSRVTGTWGIPISYPLTHTNAGISVIFASIENPSIQALYETIRPKPGGAITLVRGDGIILSRAPFDEKYMGKPIGEDLTKWKSIIAAAPIGIFEARSTGTDNEIRLVAYNSTPDLSLVVSVSVRIQDVLAEWHNNAIWQGSVVCIMVCLIAVLFFRLVKALHGLDKAHAELQENLELVRKSDETKDKLFSVIAHDLRGPIGGMASLLGGMALDRRSISDEEMGQFLNVLRDTSWNTSQLLENLLAWSRSQRAELSFNPERLALLPLVMECEAIFELSSAEKGISVAIDIEEGLAARADPDQLRILVRNMLSNAIKFTPPGKSVRLRAARTRDGTLIEARDEGIGMNAQQIASLFDLGAARSRSGTANEKGSGLGLVLCKSIVDMHGGRIEVASEVGKGSSFSIFLPD